MFAESYSNEYWLLSRGTEGDDRLAKWFRIVTGEGQQSLGGSGVPSAEWFATQRYLATGRVLR